MLLFEQMQAEVKSKAESWRCPEAYNWGVSISKRSRIVEQVSPSQVSLLPASAQKHSSRL
jgi:hypothetical protein